MNIHRTSQHLSQTINNSVLGIAWQEWYGVSSLINPGDIDCQTNPRWSQNRWSEQWCVWITAASIFVARGQKLERLGIHQPSGIQHTQTMLLQKEIRRENHQIGNVSLNLPQIYKEKLPSTQLASKTISTHQQYLAPWCIFWANYTKMPNLFSAFLLCVGHLSWDCTWAN